MPVDVAISAGAEGAELRALPFSGLDDLNFIMFARSVIHAQQSPTWAAWLDSDEYLFCADWARTLDAYAKRGATALRPGKGWQMVSPTLPTTDRQIYDEVNMGHDEPGVAKPCIVRAGTVPMWEVGKHQIAGGDTPAPEIVMAHFRNMGIERQLGHNADNEARKSARQRANRWGFQTAPEYDEGERKVFQERLAKVERVVFPK
jgi:hypothetical protein